MAGATPFAPKVKRQVARQAPFSSSRPTSWMERFGSSNGTSRRFASSSSPASSTADASRPMTWRGSLATSGYVPLGAHRSRSARGSEAVARVHRRQLRAADRRTASRHRTPAQQSAHPDVAIRSARGTAIAASRRCPSMDGSAISSGMPNRLQRCGPSLPPRRISLRRGSSSPVLPGISGGLVASAFLEEVLLPEIDAGAAVDAAPSFPALQRWWTRVQRQLGPASSARAVLDVAALPLVEFLHYRVLHLEPHQGGFVGTIGAGNTPVAVLRTTLWGADPDLAWRDAVRAGRTARVSWGLVCTGPALRIVDASRAWSRRALDFDLAAALADRRSATALHALTCSAALASTDARSLARIVDRADAHGVRVCETLGGGVLDALTAILTALEQPNVTARRRGVRQAKAHMHAAAFEQALTIVYRLLFLLFAEARALVPTWHDVYREAYTIDGLCRRVVQRRHGLWAALQAISRLAHAGCRAGDLIVTPFNGRLFSPSATPLGEGRRVSDEAVGRAVMSLATAPAKDGRRRIAYADLGVEQLGSIYERVLEYEPCARTRPRRPHANVGRAEEHGQLLHPACDDGVSRPSSAASARRGTVARRDPAVADCGSGNGQRRVPGRRVPLSCRCARTRAAEREHRLGSGRTAGSPRRASPPRGAAMSLRRGPESDGGAARAAVAMAHHTRPRSPAHVSRSPPCVRRQPARRGSRAIDATALAWRERALDAAARTAAVWRGRTGADARRRSCPIGFGSPWALRTRPPMCERRNGRSPSSARPGRRSLAGKRQQTCGARTGFVTRARFRLPCLRISSAASSGRARRFTRISTRRWRMTPAR